MNNDHAEMSEAIVMNRIRFAGLKTVFLRVDLAAFILCVMIFLIWPRLDLYIGNSFFNPETGGFHGVESSFLFIAYEILGSIQIPILLIIILRVFYSWFKRQREQRSKYLFLLCCFLLGPGVLVNIILKENSTGRPRPRHIVEYGFEAQYAAPFEYSGQCSRNCSFVSGHSSVGFFFIALAWVTRQRRYIAVGLVLGGAIGLMRMSQGGHFLSDVIFAFWAVYGTCILMSRLFGYTLDQPDTSSSEETP